MSMYTNVADLVYRFSTITIHDASYSLEFAPDSPLPALPHEQHRQLYCRPLLS